MTTLLESNSPAKLIENEQSLARHILLNAQLLRTETSYRSAGVSQYSRNLLNELGMFADNAQTELFSNPYRFSAFTSAKRFHTSGVEIYRDDLLPFRRGIHNPYERILWEQTRLARHAENLQVDLIHGLVNVLPLRSNVPGVVTVHDLTFLRLPKLFPWAKRTYLTYLCRESASRAKRIIAVSQQTADDLIEFFDVPAQKIDVVHNGVDERFHPGTEADIEAFRQHKQLPERFLLYLGTLEPRKNLELLIKAFADWKRSEPAKGEDVKLVVAGGKGWFYEEIFTAVKELAIENDVLFPGYIPEKELPDWYRAAEIFVYPSQFEGFGLPVLEAMACGVPVICSQTGSLVELVNDAAITVTTESPKALTAAIDKLIGDATLRKDLRQRGLARSSLFSWAQAAQQTVDVYNHVLDGQPGRAYSEIDAIPFTSKTIATLDSLSRQVDGSDEDRASLLDQIQKKLTSRATPEASRLAQLVQKINAGWWPYLLVISDILLLFSACIVAYIVRYSLQWFRAVDPAFEIGFSAYLPIALALTAIVPFAYWFSKVYPFDRSKGLSEKIYNIATATTASVVVVISASLVFQPQLNSRLIFLYIVVLNTLFVGVSRAFVDRALLHLRKYGIGVQHTLIVGLGDVGRMVMRNIVARPQLGYQLVGFLDDHPTAGSTDIGHFKALGSTDNLEAVLKMQDVQRVIICLPWQRHETTQKLLRTCEQVNVQAQVVPDLFQFTKSQMVVDELNGIPLISTRSLSIQGWNLFLKRIADLVFTLTGGILLLPILAAISIAIWLDSKGPIFYSQIRIGRNRQPFRCYKFRSMVTEADELRKDMMDQNEATGPLFKVRNDPRCTRVGRFLRRYSLDELPQLYNVLLGQMSLVGPRPNMPEEVAQYQAWHGKRLSVSPGITGLWQVSGRSDLTFDEMVLLDIYYVENWSVMLDISILLRSIPAIIRGRGAY